MPLWVVRYRIALVTLDLCCIILATIVAYELRFAVTTHSAKSLSYLGIGGIIAVFRFGPLSHEMATQSLSLFMREVAPQFRH